MEQSEQYFDKEKPETILSIGSSKSSFLGFQDVIPVRSIRVSDEKRPLKLPVNL